MIAIVLFVFKLLFPSSDAQGELFGEPTPNSKEKNVEKIHYNPDCDSPKANGEPCTKHGYNPNTTWDEEIQAYIRVNTCGNKAHKELKFGIRAMTTEEKLSRKVGRITAAWLGENQEPINPRNVPQPDEWMLPPEARELPEEEYCSYCHTFMHVAENCPNREVEDDDAIIPTDNEWMGYSVNFAKYNEDMSLSVVSKKRITTPFDMNDAYITNQGFMVCGVRFNLAHTKSVPSSVFVRNRGDNSLVVYKIIIGLDAKRNKTIDLVDVTSAYEAAKARGAVRWMK